MVGVRCTVQDLDLGALTTAVIGGCTWGCDGPPGRPHSYTGPAVTGLVESFRGHDVDGVDRRRFGIGRARVVEEHDFYAPGASEVTAVKPPAPDNARQMQLLFRHGKQAPWSGAPRKGFYSYLVHKPSLQFEP